MTEEQTSHCANELTSQDRFLRDMQLRLLSGSASFRIADTSSLVVTGLVYKAYTNSCQHKYISLPRLRPFFVKPHRLLQILQTHDTG